MKMSILNLVVAVSSMAAVYVEKAQAYTGADLCKAAYMRDYESIKSIVQSGVHPDQNCKASWTDGRTMYPSPLVIIFSDIRSNDYPGQSTNFYQISGVNSSTDTFRIGKFLIESGANPNFISPLTKTYRTTNFIAILSHPYHNDAFSNDSELVDLFLSKNADIHLSANFMSNFAVGGICYNSPIGALLRSSTVEENVKLHYVTVLKNLGANECD